jgi:hypothetical protein
MRLTATAMKCIDLFTAYCEEEITVHEMNIELALIEFKQLKLPFGKP